jgi:transposase
MYTIQKAAAILGIKERTVKRWMKQCGIEGKLIEADGKRLYITYNDIISLVDHYDQKTAKGLGKKVVQKGEIIAMMGKEEVNSSQNNEEKVVYSINDTALILGVAKSTVKDWISKHNIKRLRINTDRKRVYIARNDVLLLADLHGRKIANKSDANGTIKREDNGYQENNDKEAYSIEDAVLYLGVSQNTVRRWILRHNIKKEIRITDQRRVYITRDDIHLLADLYGRKKVPGIYPMDIVEDLKEIRAKLKAHDSEFEDIKHDLRVYVSRSIYVG